MKKIITFMALMMLGLSVHAVTFTVDSICYQTASGGVNVVKESSGYDNYENLVNIVIPSVVSYNGHNYQVVRIADQAFRYAQNLETVEIPNTVTMIGDGALFNCPKLHSVIISSSVKTIGTNNLRECPELEEIWVDPDNTVYDSRDNCNALIKTSTNELLIGSNSSFVPATVESIADYAFSKHKRLKTMTIPPSVTSVGYQAFASCDSLEHLSIEGPSTWLGVEAFANCYSLNNVHLSEGIQKINTSCFMSCSSLESIVLPQSVTVIDSCAFLYCSKLKTVNLGENIQRIGGRAFMYCSGLSSIYSNIQMPQNVSCGNRIFDGVDKSMCMLYVPEASISLYKAISPWKDFTNIVENTYVPLVRKGVVWEYVGFRQDEDENPIHTLYTLELNGTTEIDGLLYHNVIRTDYDEQGNAKQPYIVTFVREENKVVTAYKYNEDYYYENYWWCIPKTLYDFNKEMFLPDWSYEDLPEACLPTDYMNPDGVSSIEVEIGGTTRKGYYIDNGNEYYSFKTIEGIGVDCNFGDLLVPYRNYYTGFNPMAGLAAVYENGKLVYKGCKYNRAQSLKKDVDGDGAVTAADVSAIYNFLLNSADDYDYNEMYDVNGDNMVTAADITAIYNVILGGQ
ncbi:MAG: leucine-rich repeat protein [Muribaculaceae bacterium]|nr:leucine-rich repeat protein [Muribaculaceae bacterium]